MAHSPDLIKSILTKIQIDYPADQFRFTTEQAIPGTRLMPDIFVTDITGSLCCAVEIGYTRPEKLTAYRKKLKIPDVRWYDKQGNLHADVEEKVIRVSVQQQPTGTFAIYRIRHTVECRNESCESIAMIDCELTVEELQNPGDRVDEVCEKAWEVSNHLCEDVTTVIVTDYVRAWFICYCDKCGDLWDAPMNSSMDLEGIAFDLEDMDAGEFGRSWGARRFYGDWAGACRWVLNYFGIHLEYKKGEFLSVEMEQRHARSIAPVRLEAARI